MLRILTVFSLIFIFSCEQNMLINENNNPDVDNSLDITRGLKIHMDDDGNLIESRPLNEYYDPLNCVHLFLDQSRIQINLSNLIGSDERNYDDYGDFGTVHFNNKELMRFENVTFFEWSWGNEGLLDIPDYDQSQKMSFDIKDSPDYLNTTKVLSHSINEYLETSLDVNEDSNTRYEFDRDIDFEFNKNLSIKNSYIQVSFHFTDKDETDPSVDNYYGTLLFLVPTEELRTYTLRSETILDLLKSSIKRLEKNILRRTGKSKTFKNINVIRMYMNFTTKDLQYDNINLTRTGSFKNYDLPIYMYEADTRSYKSNVDIDLSK